jgi:hypothetical protein
MNLLLDTHAALWWWTEPHKLSPTAHATRAPTSVSGRGLNQSFMLRPVESSHLGSSWSPLTFW